MGLGEERHKENALLLLLLLLLLPSHRQGPRAGLAFVFSVAAAACCPRLRDRRFLRSPCVDFALQSQSAHCEFTSGTKYEITIEKATTTATKAKLSNPS
jgi:hypothetical protein